MAGLLGGAMSGLGGLLGSPRTKDALLASFAAGGNPAMTAGLVTRKQEREAEAERARQMEEYRQLQMAEARRQAEEAQKRQAQEIIARTTLQHFSENPNAIAFGGPQGNPQTQLAGLLSRGVDPTAAGGLISAGSGAELPADARLYEWANGDPSRMAFLQRSNQAQMPANIQEWQQYQGMTPEQQAAYLNMKRSGYGYDVGGVPQYRGAGGEVTPLATPEQVAANRGQQSAAQAAGTETGKADALAVIDLPKIESSSAYMGNLLDELKSHPGKGYAVGASSVAPILPGTPAAGFMSRLSQIKGGQFLKAYEQLKGAGTITEIEGLKAEQAIARMERAQSEPDFDAAVDDFKGVITRAAEAARARASRATTIVPGSSPAQGGKPARLVYDPATGTVK